MKKKIDPKIQTLIDNCSKTNQRGFLLIIGDRGKDQVVNFHYLLSKSSNIIKPKVLWCYKKDLGFSSHRKKRMKEIQKLQKKGLYNANIDEPFELFTSSNEIRYCFYKETEKILGNTFSLLVLQDFESITPNILCRTIETIEGGGLVILLIKTLNSLKQLYSLVMDVHQRYRTDAHQDIEPRFNERFILSLSSCKNFIAMDDELNVLPISSYINEITPVLNNQIDEKINKELQDLKTQLENNNVLGPLIKISKTLDQAKALMVFVESISEKNFRCTVSLTAGRGRGKSAAIGLSIAAALGCGFSNIFVTAPSPENLKTLFEFIFKGLESLGYKENMHYEIIQSTNPDFNNSVIRVNIFKTHRQFVQYILPNDYEKLGQADLVVIDEAAAIPLIYVKKLLGPYLVFLSSTINGYEGTGRSLSLKLIQKLREEKKIALENGSMKSASGGRVLKEITLNDPIRYSLNDPIEKWMHELLLLNATSAPPLLQGLPHPNDCELYLVNRDTLFSYHKSTEKFLFNMMSLFISSHYKNSPNDLQLMSDAPAHLLFVLLGPLTSNSDNKNQIPDILCVIQIALEGNISSNSIIKQRGIKPSGDLIPWTISDQYQDTQFPRLYGARVIRIASHPGAQKMGYGSKSLEILTKFFEGKLINLDDGKCLIDISNMKKNQENLENEMKLTEETLKPRKKLEPILKKLTEVRPPLLHYLGVSFGLTKELFNFWRKNTFYPVYLRQSKNDLTAEHSCIMIKKLIDEAIENEDALNVEWLNVYYADFKRRFLSLLAYEFKEIDITLSIGILEPNLTQNSNEEYSEINENDSISKEELNVWLNLYDLKRLEAYSKNMVDFHLIIDLLPSLARLFFSKKFARNLKFSYSQAAILMGMGLQHKSVDQIAGEINLPVAQVLALFNKSIRKLTNHIKAIYEKEIENSMGHNKELEELQFNPLKRGVIDELEEKGKEIISNLEKKNKKIKVQENTEKANMIMRTLKRKAKEEYDVENLTEEQLAKSLKTNDGKALVIQRQNKTEKL